MGRLTHTDGSGKARMVDISDKAVTLRKARASARVRMARATREAIEKNALEKGDVLGVARVAGIMAAKQAGTLLPLAHPLPIESADVRFGFEESGLTIRTEVVVRARTGVEMEALTAAAVAALTVYDMAKAIDRRMEITDLHLDFKSGGRSGTFEREKIA